MGKRITTVLGFVGATAITIAVERLNLPSWLLAATVVVSYGGMFAYTLWPRLKAAWSAFRNIASKTEGDSDPITIQCRILAHNYMRLVMFSNRLNEPVTLQDLKTLRKALDDTRGALINLSPSIFSMATAMSFQAPQHIPWQDTSVDATDLLTTDQVKEQLLFLTTDLQSKIHQKWEAYGGKV